MSRALERHRDRFEADPADPQAFALLEEHLSREGDWPALCALYERHLGATAAGLAPDARARLLFRRAQAVERAGFGEADFTAALEQAIALDPDFTPALRELQRHYEESEQWSALARALESAGRLDEAAEVRDRARASTEPEPAPVPTPAGPPVDADPAPGGPPADADAELETDGDELAWIEVLEQQAAEPDLDPAERMALLVQIGRLQRDALVDPEAACDAFQLALTLDPVAAAPLEELEQLLRKLEHFDELERVLLRAAEAEPDVPERWCALGALRAGERGDPAGAAAAFERALDASPDHEPARLGLRAAARASGDPAVETRALVREADACALADLPGRIAELVERGELDAALPAARRWLEREPDRREALQALAQILGDLGHTEELVEVLERLDGALDGPERAANQRRLGYLHAAEGRSEAALAAWRAALEADPEDIASLEAMMQMLASEDRASEALAVLEDQQRRRGRAAEPRSLALHRARALEGAGRFDEALAVFRELRQSWAGVPEVLDGFERMVRATGDDAGLAECLTERVAAAKDPERRAMLQLERAIVLEERLARSLEAGALYAALVDEAADDAVTAEAQTRLESILERSGDFVALRDQLERRIERTPRDERATLHARIAELCRTSLDQPEAARGHLRRALEAEPDRGALWRQLASLLDESEHATELLDALEAELACGAEDGGEAPLRARAAGLAERLGEPARAETHFRRLLELDPAQPDALRFLGARLAARGAWQEWAERLEAAVGSQPADPDDEPALGLRLELAALWAERLERPDEAAALLEALGAPALRDARVAEQLFEIHRLAGRSAELQHLCARVAAEAPAAERAGWWLRLGEALRPADAPGAIEAYRKALECEPRRASAREALAELLREQSDGEGLASLLEQALSAGIADPGPYHRELADLYEGPLERPADALPHLRRAVELAPADLALRERAVARAEAENDLDAALALLREGLEQPAWSRCPDRWRRAAEWLAGPLGRMDEAIDAYRECVARDGSDLRSRRALRSLLEQAGRWQEALALLERELESCEGELRAEGLAYGADAAERQLGPAAARPWLDRLAPLAEGDPELLDAIAAAQLRAGCPTAAERAWARAAEADPDPGGRAFRHRQRARLLEGIGALAPARAALEQAHALDPALPSQWVDLERLARRTGHWRLQAEMLERRGRRQDGAERRTLLARAAACVGLRLGEAERAADLWLEVLAEARADERRRWLPAAGDAVRAAGREREWTRLAEQELAAGAATPERERQLRSELVRVFTGPLASPGRALSHARALADASCEATGDSEARREQLFALLRQLGCAAELARRLERHLVSTGGDAEGWIELARLREEKLADVEGAARAWRAALAERPASPAALSGLRRCCERAGAWSEVVELLGREIEAGTVEPASAWLRAGQLLWRELDDRDRAAAAFERARSLDPASLGALRGLQETAAASRAWHRLRELREAEIEVLGDGDPGRRRELWLGLAELATGPIPDDARAARAFQAAAALEPLDPERQRIWAACLERSGDVERWTEVFEVWCDGEASPASADDHLRLARAHASAGRCDAARARLARVLEQAPQYVSGWETSAELCERAGDRAGAAAAWIRAAECAEGSRAAESFVRAATQLDAGQAEHAAELLERALERDPSSAEGLARLAPLARDLGHLERCANSAWRLLSAANAGGGIAAELCREAWIAGTGSACQLGRWSQASALATAVLAEDPRQPDALAAAGVAAFHQDDPETCHRRLAERLEQPASDAERAEWLSLRGAALEVGACWEEALECHREALTLDGALGRAHAGLTRCLERLGRAAEAAEALATWAACGGEGAADRWLRAARLAEGAPGRESWLRSALEAEPDGAAAHLELARSLWLEERWDDAFEVASAGAERVRDPAVVSSLETLRGRVLESRGQRNEALDAYQRAAALDADACEAALSAGRLLVRQGQWRDAADLLGSFAERHRSPAGCAELLVQRGRLLAGVLEDLEGAEAAYRRACELAPERGDARDALGSLLAQLPDRGQDAASVHRQILAETPQRGASIRALTRIAQREGDADRARRGCTLLRALGVATAGEREAADDALDFAVEPRTPRASAPGEPQRRALLEAAPTLARLGHLPPDPAPVEDPAAAALREAEEELFGAPGWLCCEPAQLSEAVDTLRAAAAGRATPESRAEALAGALDKAGARRIRRTLGRRDAAGFDARRWQVDGRARAAARAVDRLSGALRPVLLALLDAPDLAEDVDLETRIAECPAAQLLLTRVLEAWLAS